MCGSKKPAPTQPTVDPAAERQSAADTAAQKANAATIMDARRKRGQQGLLSSDSAGSFSALALHDNTRTAGTMANAVAGALRRYTAG